MREMTRTLCQMLAKGAGDNFFAVYRIVDEMLVALHPNEIVVFGRCSPY